MREKLIARLFVQTPDSVICIDKIAGYGHGLTWNHIPNGAEDQTGDRPLKARAHWLKHAEFFVDLPTGWLWLARAVETTAVLITGFTHPPTSSTRLRGRRPHLQ